MFLYASLQPFHYNISFNLSLVILLHKIETDTQYSTVVVYCLDSNYSTEKFYCMLSFSLTIIFDDFLTCRTVSLLGSMVDPGSS